MSHVDATATEAPTTPSIQTSVDRTAAQLWLGSRRPVQLAAAALVAAVLLALSQGTPRPGLLDPREASPDGSLAVAEVLRDQGVQVELVRTSAAVSDRARAGDTVLIAFPGRLVEEQAAAVLATGADIVSIGDLEPERLVPAVTVADVSEEAVLRPSCELPAARRAGPSAAGGLVFNVDQDELTKDDAQAEVDSCFPRNKGASLVQVRSESQSVTFVGSREPFRNSALADEGNAALTLSLLGSRPTLVWYLPSITDRPAGDGETWIEMLPGGVWWGLGQAAVALLLLALWRGRRLGPVVVEPLPVVVRATETAEGRGRLYRRTGARGKAAHVLRAGVLARLLPAVGLSRLTSPDAVLDAVAARSRRTAPEVAALLYGAAPIDDARLVQLATDLDDLEREVRRP